MVKKAARDGERQNRSDGISAACSDHDPFSLVAQLYATLFFVCVRGNGQKSFRVELGYCCSVDDLFVKLGDGAQIPAESMKKVSICLPLDVGDLQGLDIQAGDQRAFELLIEILVRGVVDVGATVPGRHILPTVIVLSARE